MNSQQRRAQNWNKSFITSNIVPEPFKVTNTTLTFHVGQDVELGRVVVGSFAEFSTDPNFLVLLFKDGDCTERSLA